MARKIAVILLLGIHLGGFSQVSPELWLSGAVKRKLTPKLTGEASLDLRFYDFAMPGTLFPQLSLGYKVFDGVKVSVDYRMIFDENKYTNYTFDNRLNFNLDLRMKFKYFDANCRFRYQSSFGTLRTVENYSPEFDQAFRIKPSIDIKLGKKSRYSPSLSGEWFYSPANKALGDRFTKYRLAAGTEINLKGPQELDIKYIFGKSINLPKNATEHILSLTYTYDWEKLTPEEKIKREKAKARKKQRKMQQEEPEE